MSNTLMNGTEYIDHLGSIKELEVLTRNLMTANGVIHKDVIITPIYAISKTFTHVLVSWDLGTSVSPTNTMIVHNELIKIDPSNLKTVYNDLCVIIDGSAQLSYKRFGIVPTLHAVFLIPDGDLLKR